MALILPKDLAVEAGVLQIQALRSDRNGVVRHSEFHLHHHYLAVAIGAELCPEVLEAQPVVL